MTEQEIALANLYNASRLASLTADQHDGLKRCVELLKEAIKPASEEKEEAE